VTNQVIGNQSIKTIDVTSPNSKIVKLDDSTTQRIADIQEIDAIGRAYYFPGSLKISNSESDTIVYGIDKSYESLTYLSLMTGILPSTAKTTRPVVLNKSALEAIGLAEKPEAVIGKSVSLKVPLSKVGEKLSTFSQEFTVVGVINSGSGSEVFIPTSIFHDLGVSTYTQLKVGVKNVNSIQKIRTQIESFGLETASPVDTLNEINSIFRYFNFILVGFGAIGMIIAVIGMLNTLTISLLERTKEIGLMVALGARPIDMRKLFMFEALLLSVFGTIVGILVSVIVGMIADVIVLSLIHISEPTRPY
jgi:ABC-type antimicrobial peptide transport system permease subunit